MGFASLAQADTYVLVADDKIRLRVVEWRATDAQYANLEALGGTYIIDSSGEVAIPIAGRIAAVGKTTDQLSQLISTALADKADLPAKPFIALEIAEHAPIFIVGAVETPGRYPFETSMTVMKAVSIAGGFSRRRGDNAAFERDQIQAAGDYRTAILNRRALLMRKSRLAAEIAGQQTFETPSELVSTPDIEILRNEELDLMRLRRIDIESRVAAADDLAKLYAQEIQTLSAKIVTQKRQIDLSQQELDTVNSLVSKGLTNNARQFSADRGLAEAQSRQLDLEIALTRARQSLSESGRERIDIVNKQNAENQRELNSVELAIRKTAIDLQIAQMLGDQAGVSAEMAQTSSDELAAGLSQRSFKISRKDANGSGVTIDANETTTLLPHDLIEVIKQGSANVSSIRSAPPSGQKLAKIDANSDAEREEP
jgi:exopolysaccharide production protein ExoF